MSVRTEKAMVGASSSRSRAGTLAMAFSISFGVRRNDFGLQLSNFSDSSRTALSPFVSISARMPSTVLRTFGSAALISLASIPRLRNRAIGSSL